MQPRSSDLPALRADDVAACRALLRTGSRSFHAASLVMPQPARDAATVLYAFCRLADDAVDLGHDQVAAIADLRARLRGIYAGTPDEHPVDRAFAAVVARHRLPRELPEALIEGLEWDAQGRRYRTISDVRAYGARVAGTVGAMMTVLMGVRAPDVIARACDLGVAMQLTNIARDVGEDARLGRLYLPEVWMGEAGLDPDAWLAGPCPSGALAQVVQRLLDEADVLYRRAAIGIDSLPAACRPGMHAARLIYAEIGRQVERNGLDSVTQRAIVPGSRKMALLVSAILDALGSDGRLAAPPLDEVRFLVDAVEAASAWLVRPVRLPPSQIPWWNLTGRIAWVVDLFHDLKQREAAQQVTVPVRSET